MKIAYIVSLYFGTRRVQASGYRQDKLFYLRKHIEHLTRLKHSCSKIIFVINHSLDHQEITETKRAIKLILDFKVEHSDKKVEILRRENSGMSYAAWDEALKRSCKDVDYTFLIEDDYCPVSNNFDEKFLHYFAENQKCFLNLLTDHGYEVRDTGDVYRNYFLNHLSELKIYGNKDGEDLILPIHENAKWV